MTSVESKLRKLKPTTPSKRHANLIDRRNLWRGKPVWQLTAPKRRTGGRGGHGNITVRHIGGGHKRRYRLIDFKRDYCDVPAVVQRFEHDPNRSAFIALIAYPDGNVSYIIAPQTLKVGDTVISSKKNEVDITVGNAMPLRNIPIGTPFCCMELYPGKGAQISRSAGTHCTVMDKGTSKVGHALVTICSKEQRHVPLDCMGMIGVVSNEAHHLVNYGKAGRMRWLGVRPTVRGVAMNPVDHPLGGGEGKSSGGRPHCSPTGFLAKCGYKSKRRGFRRSRSLIVVPRRIANSKKRGKK